MLIKYLILLAYFLVLFIIGIIAARRINSLADYYVGGKKLGFWVVAFSARATGESGWLLLGLTGMGAWLGLPALWVVLGEVLGVAFAWFFMAKPFKRLTDSYESITIPDFLVSHFKSKGHLLRIIAATTLSVFVVIYVSAQIDISGKAFETFLGWDYFVGVFVGFSIVLLYTYFGGFVAVAWSDLFQGLIMLLCLVGLPILVYLAIASEGNIWQGLAEIDPALLNAWGPGGFSLMNLMTALGLAGIGLGFLGSPQVFVRLISIKDEAEIDKGKWVAIVFTLLTDTAAVWIGLLGRYVFTTAQDDVIAVLGPGAENVLPMLVDQFLPLALAGLFLAAVLAAIMSTIDSLLVLASSAVTRDFYQQILRPDLTDQALTQTSRMVTLGMAALALGISLAVALLSPDRTIFWFAIFGWSGIAATFCPMMLLALFWRGYTEAGAIASMITGFVSIPIFKFGMTLLPGAGPYFEQLAEMIPSFSLALIIGYIVSRLR